MYLSGGWTNSLLKLANKENKLPPRRLNQDKFNTFISGRTLMGLFSIKTKANTSKILKYIDNHGAQN